MAAAPVPAWPKIVGLKDYIGEFDRDTKTYRKWRNQLENAFKIFKIEKLMIYDRYSGNPQVGFTLRAEDYDSAGNNAHPCRWTTDLAMQVFAIVRTKLKDVALEIFDAEIGSINTIGDQT